MPHSHDEIMEAFLKARGLPKAELETFLGALSGTIRPEVESLLKYDCDQEDSLSESSSLQPDIAKLIHLYERPTPSKIGPYRIIERIGVGGMGIVYRAEQERPRRFVALKVLRSALESESSIRRFDHEIRLLGLLKHPGIAQIYEAGYSSDLGVPLPYFAMELVEGSDLRTYCEHNKLSTRQKLALVSRIADAVHYAHQNGVIHRDLKPGNILVDNNGVPKILDFGIAKATDSDVELTTSHTDLANLVGTIPYMSPEQAAGIAEDIDIRADVYAIGVLLYELLADRLPYPVRDRLIHEAVRVIREESPVPLSTIDRLFRGDVENIVSKSLQKEKQHRYASADALASDIRRYLRNEPIDARPPSRSYLVRKFATRNKDLVLGIGMAMTALVAGLLISLFLLFQADEAKESAANALERALESERIATLEAARAREAETRALSVSALQEVEGLSRDVRALWPLRPERVEDMNSWLSAASAHISMAPTYERYLSQLVEERELGDPDSKLIWLQGVLESLLNKLDGLDGEDGLAAEIRKRLEVAETIERQTIDEYREDWDAVVESLQLDERFRIHITPQVGLVPLGQDPVTEFWEFWVFESGERPERGKDEQWEIEPDTGIILVLLPGGSFRMGSSTDVGDSHYDSRAVYDEQPVHSRVLDPFLISKYELTQGQAHRILRDHSNYYRARGGVFHGTASISSENGPTHPAERLSWTRAFEAAQKLDLILPTEAQWEYACRAGTTRPWSVELEALRTLANLADRSAKNVSTDPLAVFEEWYDRWDVHAPVGSYLPNRFGLFDMHGNVSEWCADWYGHYGLPCETGTGLRLVDENARFGRIYRGGSFGDLAGRARAAYREQALPSHSSRFLGVRFARNLVGFSRKERPSKSAMVPTIPESTIEISVPLNLEWNVGNGENFKPNSSLRGRKMTPRKNGENFKPNSILRGVKLSATPNKKRD